MSKLSRSLSRMKQVMWALQPFDPDRRVAARRNLLWRLLQGHADTIVFERNGVRWAAPVRSSITAALFSKGEYQHESMPPLFAWLERNRPGWHGSSTIVNIGAHLGDTCVTLALKTGKRVVACEPVPELFDLLQQNVRANGLEGRVACHRVAIAARSGTAEMICPEVGGEGSEVRTESGVQGFRYPPEQCTVHSTTLVRLDALLENSEIAPGEVGLVWSDTQGFESEVIESGEPLWRAGVPLWVEVWPKGLAAHGGIGRFLALTRQHFRRFLPEGALHDRSGEARDVRLLEDIMPTLTRRAFMDVLLVP